jgi:cation diffusion facilitator CzcD-associated flavoprotein CzcO
MTTNSETPLECDYLIVGAGAAPLAFIDTMLTELPETKIILIDKKAAPGGHWVDAYGFVRLHQPSIVYGISSKQLEGNWLKVMITEFMLPWKHRANKQQILTYFGDFVNEKVASQQVKFYPNCVYNLEKNNENDSSTFTDNQDGMCSFSSVDGSVTYKVKVNVKLINATAGECIIPCGT